MTDKAKQLLAELEKELQALPEEEQEEVGEALLNVLRRCTPEGTRSLRSQRTREQRDDEAVFHPSLDVLQDAQIEELPSDYSERLDHYLYGAEDE